MCCNFFLSAWVQLLTSVFISSSMLIMLKSVSELVWLSSDVDSAIGNGVVSGTVVKTGLNNKQYYHKYCLIIHIIVVVCILVWHITLFSMEFHMIFGEAKYYCLTKKIIGSTSFRPFLMSFILGGIFSSNLPVVMVSSYS